METQLTDLALRSLAPPARGQFTVWDKSSPIGVRVSAGGAKTFIVMIGSGRRHSIGRVGIISLADARAKAKRLFAERTLGIIHERSPVDFATALMRFVEGNYQDKNPRTKKEVDRVLRKHFLPTFRGKSLSDITDHDVDRVLSSLAHVPSERLHAFRTLRAMLRWCTRPPRRYIRFSPLEGYPAPGHDRKGTRVLTDDELVRVWNACTGRFGDLVRLLILWGTRKGETARIQRQWVEDGVLTIPGACTKNKRPHAIPLLPMASAILDARSDAGPYFFGSRWHPDSHLSDGAWGKLKRELDDGAGVHDWQIRDLRRTFRSNMAKLRVPREIAEILLNHVTGSRNVLDEIYDRYDYLAEKKEALAAWEARLAALLKQARAGVRDISHVDHCG
jgi:Arm DNA-binding domain